MVFEDENGIIPTCEVCGSSPCEWTEIESDILVQGETFSFSCQDSDGNVENVKVRKCLYKYYTYWKYGRLGQAVRIPIPVCVLDQIRELWPSDEYTGFMSV